MRLRTLLVTMALATFLVAQARCSPPATAPADLSLPTPVLLVTAEPVATLVISPTLPATATLAVSPTLAATPGPSATPNGEPGGYPGPGHPTATATLDLSGYPAPAKPTLAPTLAPYP